ncbi:MAG: 8-oxo-dGTP diphosphatase [Clostridia bacterium]|nr:8-oxo-dGTP diphosphatase [Clostridia bacterium]
MRRTETVILANMCMIYDENGNVLVQNRIDPSWSGIAFPGGHVEKGEPLTDAVIREVYEETGLSVSNLQMCGVKDWIRDDGTRYIVFLYKTNTFSGTLTSSEEGEVFWVPIDKLPTMNIASSLTNLLKLFEDDTITEQFFYKENGEWVEILK